MSKSYYIPTLRNSDECRDWLNRNNPLPTVHRGDVWFARLGKHKYSSVQEGIRPVLIISNEANNRNSSTVTVIPFTGHLKRPDLPTHVVVERLTGPSGAAGSASSTGSARASVAKSTTGSTGSAGMKGTVGSSGPSGARSTTGLPRSTGSSGLPRSTGSSGLPRPTEFEKSVALVEQVTTLDKHRLIEKIGKINDPGKMEEIDRAVMIQFGLAER